MYFGFCMTNNVNKKIVLHFRVCPTIIGIRILILFQTSLFIHSFHNLIEKLTLFVFFFVFVSFQVRTSTSDFFLKKLKFIVLKIATFLTPM